jgi:hypothetical protein
MPASVDASGSEITEKDTEQHARPRAWSIHQDQRAGATTLSNPENTLTDIQEPGSLSA